MKKILKCIFINLLIFIILFFTLDILVFLINKYGNEAYRNARFRYCLRYPFAVNYYDIVSAFMIDPERRIPEGLEYPGSPIVIFGCSFAYGEYLKQSQTFGHKLSTILKRPVYNRAIRGQSFQEMYFQTEDPVFYRQVPDFDTAIYVMIDDSYRRMYDHTCTFMDDEFALHYDIKNGKLQFENYSNPFMNFIKSLYLVKLFSRTYHIEFVQNAKNAEKVTDDVLLYFIKSRENLEKHLKHKIKFYVLIYYNGTIHHTDLLTKKLTQNGFKVIETNKLTNEELWDKKYIFPSDGHPNEAAWDLITPLVIRYLKADEEGK